MCTVRDAQTKQCELLTNVQHRYLLTFGQNRQAMCTVLTIITATVNSRWTTASPSLITNESLKDSIKKLATQSKC